MHKKNRAAAKFVDLNFKVDAKYHDIFKHTAFLLKMDMKEVMEEAFERYLNKLLKRSDNKLFVQVVGGMWQQYLEEKAAIKTAPK